jgi:isopenicillin N synthase-like dioxygenase
MKKLSITPKAPVHQIPVIDLAYPEGGDQELKQARALDDALIDIGFLMVVNHGVPEETIGRTTAICRQFFDLPLEQKLSIRSTAPGSPRGYVPMGLSVLGRTAGQDTPVDVKEGFGMGPTTVSREKLSESGPYYAENKWPAQLPPLQGALSDYYLEMEGVSRKLLRLASIALGVPPSYFLAAFEGHNNTLRVINYPPLTEPPLPGQLRAGEHTDYGAFTILLPENASGGLQVRTRGGQWIDVVAPPGAFVINVGDLMMRWTNDRWLSNFHRVGMPDESRAAMERRQSIAYFSNPREDVLVECIPTCKDPSEAPKHLPIVAGEHRLAKIRAAAGVS